MIATDLSGSGCRPATTMQKPKYLILGIKKLHLSSRTWKPYLRIFLNKASKLSLCSSNVRPVTIM